MNEFPCTIKMKRGWKCKRPYHWQGPCALVPRWWNFLGKMRYHR